MAEDDPKHADSFDAVENIEIVLLISEYLEGLRVVESLQYFVDRWILFFFFRSHTSEEGYQAQNGQQDYHGYGEVKPARFIVCIVLRIYVDCPHC